MALINSFDASTDNAIVKVFNDINIKTDSGRFSVSVLLEVSAAFDMIDHNMLLDLLGNWVGLSGSYLKDRDYFVSIGSYTSEWTKMTSGVPQGSNLRHRLFNIYMLPLAQVMENSIICR